MAVVVTCDPGPWLEETLTSLGAQDYPNLSVLVIDAASAEDPTPRVAAVLPRAYVYRLPSRVGYARAANEALSIVEGASHYLFCHDDVGLAADVARILRSEEAAFLQQRRGGGAQARRVAAARPSLVGRPERRDKTGVAARLIERGELAQEQHDSVRDVFCAPGGCYLVRADLFASHWPASIPISTCSARTSTSAGGLRCSGPGSSWRPEPTSAFSKPCPRASAPAGTTLWPAGGSAPSTTPTESAPCSCATGGSISCGSCLRRWCSTAVEALAKLLTGRPGDAAATLSAWPQAMAHPQALRRARSTLQRQRVIGDSEIRRLQVHGSARIRNVMPAHLGPE